MNTNAENQAKPLSHWMVSQQLLLQWPPLRLQGEIQQGTPRIVQPADDNAFLSVPDGYRRRGLTVLCTVELTSTSQSGCASAHTQVGQPAGGHSSASGCRTGFAMSLAPGRTTVLHVFFEMLIFSTQLAGRLFSKFQSLRLTWTHLHSLHTWTHLVSLRLT